MTPHSTSPLVALLLVDERRRLDDFELVAPERTLLDTPDGAKVSVLTTFHMPRSGLFQVGVAGAPVTDWHLYASIYTERYMGLPAEDPEAYERTSAVKAAANESGHLLLIFGTQDDNVHPQNTIQLADGLIRSRKQFDLMLYPNKTHGIRGTDENVQLWTMVAGYFERYLK